MTKSIDERYPVITIELTSDEQISLLGLIVQNIDKLLASDRNNWLPDLERIQEKIESEQERLAFELPSAIIFDYRGS